MSRDQIPCVYHLAEARLWEPVVEADSTYFPPTYAADGFIHGTANTQKLLKVANHFYRKVAGKWYCLRMTVDSLSGTGVATVFEGTAAVGNIQPGFDGADDELFPHIYGGIRPAAVLEVHPVIRADDGTFLSVEGVTD